MTDQPQSTALNTNDVRKILGEIKGRMDGCRAEAAKLRAQADMQVAAHEAWEAAMWKIERLLPKQGEGGAS